VLGRKEAAVPVPAGSAAAVRTPTPESTVLGGRELLVAAVARSGVSVIVWGRQEAAAVVPAAAAASAPTPTSASAVVGVESS